VPCRSVIAGHTFVLVFAPLRSSLIERSILMADVASGAAQVLGVLAWPTLVGFLLAAVYKNEISGLLQRGFKAKHKDTEFNFGAAQQLVPAELKGDRFDQPLAALHEIAGLTPEQQVVLEKVRHEVGGDKEKAILLLAAWLVAERSFWKHEIAYRLIFGSQIAALEFLNVAHEVPAQMLFQFYNQHVRSAEAAELPTRTFDQWLGFMLGAELATMAGNVVSIKQLGRDLLTYLTRHGIPKRKGL
jgi:hypothetical protein